MKKIAGTVAVLAFNVGYAADIPPEVLLDKVAFQVSAKQWVTTKTALLSVNINATLSDADLVKARADIMNSLNTIAKGEWHLIQFDRSQDSSGLEKLFVLAQARIDQASLTEIYQKAKSVSKPGATYEIGTVEFKPSLAEMQGVQTQLREQLYQLANAELARINKVYTGQNYSLNNLVFADGDIAQQPKVYQAREMMNTMAMPAAAPPALMVSNEVTMTAIVEAASNRQVTIKQGD